MASRLHARCANIKGALVAKTMSRRKKHLTFVLVAVSMLSGAGVAFAYWTAGGTGDGQAETGTSVDFTIAASPAVGTISPGSAGQTVDFTVTNPGPGTLQLSDVTVIMADATGVPWVPSGDCDIADYTASVTTQPANEEIQAGDSVDGQATVTLANTAVNQDACQGQAVPLYFTAS
jgi:hypothetical protein